MDSVLDSGSGEGSANGPEYRISRSPVDFESGPSAESDKREDPNKEHSGEIATVKQGILEINKKVTRLTNSWASVKAGVEGIKHGLEHLEGPCGGMIKEARLLQAKLDELRWKISASEAFLSLFTLDAADELLLMSSDGLADGGLISALRRLREVLGRCGILLGAESDSSNTETAIVENLICVGKVAFARLCSLIPSEESMKIVPACESAILKQVAVECLSEQECCDPKECLGSIIRARSIGITEKIQKTVIDSDAKLNVHVNFCFLIERSGVDLETQLHVQGLERMFIGLSDIYHSEHDAWLGIMSECENRGAQGFGLVTVMTAVFSQPISTIKRLLLRSDLINSSYSHPCPELLFRLIRSIKICEHSIMSLNLDCSKSLLEALLEIYELVDLSFKRHLVSFARHLDRVSITINDSTSIPPSKSIQKLESLMLYLCSFCPARTSADVVNIWLLEATADYFLSLIQVFATEECVNLPSAYLSVYIVNCSNHVLNSLKKTASPSVPFTTVKDFISSSVSNAAAIAVSDVFNNHEFPEQFRKLGHYCSHGIDIPPGELKALDKSSLDKGLLLFSKIMLKNLGQALQPFKLISDYDTRRRMLDTILSYIPPFYASLYFSLDDVRPSAELLSAEELKIKLESCISASM